MDRHTFSGSCISSCSAAFSSGFTHSEPQVIVKEVHHYHEPKAALPDYDEKNDRWVCGYCKSSLSDDDDKCKNCGAPRL